MGVDLERTWKMAKLTIRGITLIAALACYLGLVYYLTIDKVYTGRYLSVDVYRSFTVTSDNPITLLEVPYSGIFYYFRNFDNGSSLYGVPVAPKNGELFIRFESNLPVKTELVPGDWTKFLGSVHLELVSETPITLTDHLFGDPLTYVGMRVLLAVLISLIVWVIDTVLEKSM